MLQNILLFLSALAAYFVKGITGFGNTLVMSPLFSFIVSNRVTTPVDLLFSLPSNAFIVWKERKSISVKIVVPLSLLLLAGVIPGTFLLKAGNDRVLKSILGLIVIGLAVEMLTRKQKESSDKKINTAALIIIGVLSGVMAGLYGISALLIAYINRTTDSKSQFRANMCCVFLVDNVFRFILYLFTGILTKEVLLLSLMLSPAVILGMAAGIKVDSRLNEKTARNCVIGLLLVSGLVLLVKNIL